MLWKQEADHFLNLLKKKKIHTALVFFKCLHWMPFKKKKISQKRSFVSLRETDTVSLLHRCPWKYLHKDHPLDKFQSKQVSHTGLLLLLFSCVRLFATPWTAAHQASLSIINSQSLLKLMSIESVMPSNPLILCCRLLLPSVFPSRVLYLMSQFFASGGQSIGAAASASVLALNIQG